MVRRLLPNLFRWGIISRWLIALCIWASSMQMAYPMLSPWPVTGVFTTVVLAICLVVLALRLAERFSPHRPLWMVARPFLHGGDVIALAYIMCGVGLYLNGILTTAPPQTYFAEVVAATEEPVQLGPLGPKGHIQLRLHEAETPPQFLFLGPAFERLLPGQGVSLVMYEGGLGVRWVDHATIHVDHKTTLTSLIAQGRKDSLLVKRDIYDDLTQHQFQQAYRKAKRYFEQEPDDVSLAIDVAHAAVRARQPALAVQMLGPLVRTHYNYKLYSAFGAILRDTGDRERGIDYLKAAVGIDPHAEEAYYLLGYTYKDAGQVEASRVAFAKLVELNPGYSNLLPR